MVQVQKNDNESTGSLVRRFTKRVQRSGFLLRVRGKRFYEPSKSDFAKKKEALRRVTWIKETEKQRKLGKIQ
ncbi:MAG: 30S ribosomal protein S21 [Patescibacteria group bacterium]